MLKKFKQLAHCLASEDNTKGKVLSIEIKGEIEWVFEIAQLKFSSVGLAFQMAVQKCDR